MADEFNVRVRHLAKRGREISEVHGLGRGGASPLDFNGLFDIAADLYAWGGLDDHGFQAGLSDEELRKLTAAALDKAEGWF